LITVEYFNVFRHAATKLNGAVVKVCPHQKRKVSKINPSLSQSSNATAPLRARSHLLYQKIISFNPSGREMEPKLSKKKAD
jgi:hypothetical protein